MTTPQIDQDTGNLNVSTDRDDLTITPEQWAWFMSLNHADKRMVAQMFATGGICPVCGLHACGIAWHRPVRVDERLGRNALAKYAALLHEAQPEWTRRQIAEYLGCVTPGNLRANLALANRLDVWDSLPHSQTGVRR